jgi:inosine-uridine nucleoside N-ribohydrolase
VAQVGLPEHVVSSKMSFLGALAFLLLCAPATVPAQKSGAVREKLIIDTDIGSDVDDAFAVALALSSPEFQVLGFTTSSGDTEARARILDRMLREANRQDIPVAAGPKTKATDDLCPIGRQSRYGERTGPSTSPRLSAVDFTLEQIRKSPGEISLVAVGPLTNVAALIDKDVGTFRKVKRVLIMGGWLAALDTGSVHSVKTLEPGPEYNIACDITAAQKLFASGVKISVMPLDATMRLHLDEVKRATLLTEGTPLTDALGTLYLMWGASTPVLHDALPLAYMLKGAICPARPVHISVDDKGMTRVVNGTPNAEACLRSDPAAFFDLYMARVMGSEEVSRIAKADVIRGPVASRD